MYRNTLLAVSLWLMYEGHHFVFGVIDPKCESDCVCCIDKYCRQGSNFQNECIRGCIDGHRGSRCYELCENNCKTCHEANKCQVCYDQFYVDQDYHCSSCPSNCQTCISNTECTSCKEGFENGVGLMCENAICPDNCICDDSSCISCNNGYFDVTNSCGGICPFHCLTCKSLNECTDCIEGYYNGYKTVNGIEILLNDCTHKCRETCKICSSYDQCQQCQTGKYGNMCQYNCSLGCMDNSCVQGSGECKCRSNFIGEKCEKCISGKHGNNCNRQCPIYCKNNECDKMSGECTQGCATTNFIGFKCEKCTSGKYGEHCNVSCPVNCNNNICDRTSGDCTNGCKGSFEGRYCTDCIYGKYGSGCNLDCPDNCLNRQCDKQSGNCLQCAGNFAGIKCNSCIPGFYGNKCIQHCSRNCLHRTCDIVSGKCANGCEDNFYGDRCCVEKTQEKKDAPNTALVATAAVLGSFLSLSLAGYLVLLAIFVMKRIKISRRKHSPSRREPTYENQLENIGGQVPRTILATDTLDSGTVERNIYEGVSRVNEQEHEYQQVSHDHGMSSSRRTDTDEEIRVQMKT